MACKAPHDLEPIYLCASALATLCQLPPDTLAFFLYPKHTIHLLFVPTALCLEVYFPR